MSHESEQILQRARDALLESIPDALAIYVYGSFARDEHWPQSDLDLAVLLPHGQTIPDVLGTISIVAMRSGRDVDLVDLRAAGDVLRREVLETGRTLYSADPDVVLEWEASAMSRYARHCEEVREIVQEFHRTGVGYAR
jgi:uncharacterized protein